MVGRRLLRVRGRKKKQKGASPNGNVETRVISRVLFSEFGFQLATGSS